MGIHLSTALAIPVASVVWTVGEDIYLSLAVSDGAQSIVTFPCTHVVPSVLHWA
jgi:hypothetical protein